MLLHLHFYRKTTGEKSYHIPVGGSNGVGVFGYIDTFQELVSQVNKQDRNPTIYTDGHQRNYREIVLT